MIVDRLDRKHRLQILLLQSICLDTATVEGSHFVPPNTLLIALLRSRAQGVPPQISSRVALDSPQRRLPAKLDNQGVLSFKI